MANSEIKLCPLESVFTPSVKVVASIAAWKDYINLNSRSTIHTKRITTNDR